MSSTSNAVKITAKTALKEKWIKAIIACCIIIFSFFIISNSISVLSEVVGEIAAQIIFAIFLVFLISPLIIGLFRFFWRILFDADDNPVSVFYYFSNIKIYKRVMLLILFFSFKLIFWRVILNIPAYIVELLSHNFIYDMVDMPIPVWTANLSNFTVFLKVISAVIVFFITLRFYLAPMLFVADDNIEFGEAMHMSTIIAKKTSIDFIYLILSFLGWILLSVLLIPLIFTMPYIITSYLVHARFAVADYNKQIKLSAENTFPSFTA